MIGYATEKRRKKSIRYDDRYTAMFRCSISAPERFNQNHTTGAHKRTPILAAQMPRVPLNMVMRKSMGIQRIIKLVRVVMSFLSDGCPATFGINDLSAPANTAGIPRRTKRGNECESGKSEKTRRESCEPKYANQVFPSCTAMVDQTVPNCRS